LQFSSAAWQIKARDEWIGWDPAQRKRQLPRLINNSRFLILPWVQIPNLASYVMALALCTVIQVWQRQFGTRPWLAEKFNTTTEPIKKYFYNRPKRCLICHNENCWAVTMWLV